MVRYGMASILARTVLARGRGGGRGVHTTFRGPCSRACRPISILLRLPYYYHFFVLVLSYGEIGIAMASNRMHSTTTVVFNTTLEGSLTGKRKRQCGAMLHCCAVRCLVLCCAVRCCTVRCCTALCGAVRCDAVHCGVEVRR